MSEDSEKDVALALRAYVDKLLRDPERLRELGLDLLHDLSTFHDSIDRSKKS